jgi:hypothetical protein
MFLFSLNFREYGFALQLIDGKNRKILTVSEQKSGCVNPIDVSFVTRATSRRR